VCRHLAYLGPEIALRSLLHDAPHALVDQARTPKLQTSGNDNPDGWGVAWDRHPVERYRSALPMWEDAGFVGDERSSFVLAAARYASPGSVRDARNAAPFVDGPWAFSLNGFVSAFRDGFGDVLRALLSPARRKRLEGDTDSEVVFALVLDRLDDGASPGAALAEATRIVRAESTGALNLLLSDGEQVAATALGNSLFLRTDDALVVASEPLDGGGSWVEVDSGSLVENDSVGPIPGLAPIGEPS
jgi:gamma-glutamyl hercynylcysteine S-oxide hydrolase